MKRFKKLALSILGVTVLSLGLYACSNDADDLNTSNSQEKIETKAKFSTDDDKIKKYFGGEYKIGEIVAEDGIYLGQQLIVDGEFAGVLVSEIEPNDTDSKMGFTDLRTKGRVKYLDLINDRLFDMPLILDLESQILVPDFNGGYFIEVKDNRCQGQFTLCSAGCTVTAVAASLVDGPLPFADALAITGWTICQGLCLSSYDLCVNPPKN